MSRLSNLAGVSGGGGTITVPAVITATADNVTPLTIIPFSATQTAPILILQNKTAGTTPPPSLRMTNTGGAAQYDAAMTSVGVILQSVNGGAFTDFNSWGGGNWAYFTNGTGGNFAVGVSGTQKLFNIDINTGNINSSNQIPATNVSNKAAPIYTFEGRYWNGAASATDLFTMQAIPDPGTNPRVVLTFGHSGSSGGGAISTGGLAFTCGNLIAASLAMGGPITLTAQSATNIANVNSYVFEIDGSYWDGAASQTDAWKFQNVLGAGINPTSTLAITHTGTPGVASMTLAGLPVTVTVASGTQALATALIASGAKAATITVAATGVLTTDNLQADFNSDPTGVVGYQPSAAGMLTIIKFCTAGNVNFIVVNNTGAGITPGAITLNWRVTR